MRRLATLSALLCSSAAALQIAITGTNSGIGLSAATMLTAQGHTVFHACRTEEGSKQAVELSGGGIAMQCDLGDLSSVRKFSEELSHAAPDLDVLCLNAGVSPSRKAAVASRTKDGFEATIGINHLGHFYLAHLMEPLLRKSGGRVVVTASGVHDPDSPGGLVQGDPATGATLGDLSGLGAVEGASMVDGAAAFNGAKAYHDSKLCNVLFSREAHRRWGAQGVSVRSFNPGLITDTGLVTHALELGASLHPSTKPHVLASNGPVLGPLLAVPCRAAGQLLEHGHLLLRRYQLGRLLSARRGRWRTPRIHGDRERRRGAVRQLLFGAGGDQQGGDAGRRV